MEGLMLSKLSFQLTTPNAFVFLKRFSKVAGIISTPRSKTELLAHYLVELTLHEYKMLQYLPSTIAASAVYLALKTMGQTPWVSAAHGLNALPPPSTHTSLPPLHVASHRRALRIALADGRAEAARVLHRGRARPLRARHERAAQERADQQPAGRPQEVRAGEARRCLRYPAGDAIDGSFLLGAIARRQAARPRRDPLC
eukprot:1968433-Prymnesium_polylepis.5